MRKIEIWIGILLILAGVLLLVIESADASISYNYSFTKAVCEGSSCQDHIVVCENKKIKSLTPTGSVIEFDNYWEDPRTEEQIERLC